METGSATIKDEVPVIVTDELNMVKVMTALEKRGYNVTDVLPLLRVIIVDVTPEQRKEINQYKEEKGWINQKKLLS